MSYIYIPEISPEPHWVSDEIPEDAVFSYGTHYDQTGHKRTEETKRKMSEGMREAWKRRKNER